jgi:FemAB-related protein (PEP-CTERM system-associated)
LATRAPDGRLSGVLAVVRVRSVVFGHYLVSMPFLNYGGPLGGGPAVEMLVQSAAAEAERSGADLLELRSAVELPIGLRVSHRKVTVLLDLPDGDAEVLWRALDGKVRSQVRRPQKEGIRVDFGPDQVAPFYEVFARHMRDLGTPTHARRLFEGILEEFPDSAWVGTARLDGRPVAAGCGFRWGGEFEMTWAASLREYSRIAPNMLLYWSFMERCVQQRVRVFNFGRCTPGSGTYRFKRQWGGREEPLWWYQQARGRAATPSPDDARFRLGPRLWRRLPVPVATLLGPRIVRYLP